MEGNWTWGGEDVFGMYTLGDLGFSDFAGSGIVHMAGAAAGVAGVLVIGARKGKYTADGKVNAIPGANMPLATLGTFILWMGWFGFNGGSVLATATVSDATAVANVFMNTNAAAAGGCIAALIVAKMLFGKFDLTMALNGCLAGSGSDYRRAFNTHCASGHYLRRARRSVGRLLYRDARQDEVRRSCRCGFGARCSWPSRSALGAISRTTDLLSQDS